MGDPSSQLLRVGQWCVDPASGQISSDGTSARLEARTMRLLLCLAERAPQVVSIDELLNEVWAGVIVTPDSVYQAIASLRRLLGDDPKQPLYIATVPRLGYRMIASVGPWSNGVAVHETATATTVAAEPALNASEPRRQNLSRTVVAIAILLIVAVAAGLGAFLLHNRAERRTLEKAAIPAPPLNSVAVLPFLDLTPGMQEEEFADGITEEMIDKLSRISGLSVPPATASFYYKGKQLPVAEIGKSLGVTWVLDGSVRKSGSWIRVDTRLTRAATGYVVWSETYDQPVKNMLMIQDDIAGAVAKSLGSSIASAPAPKS
jgi:transcriptional activator of cad operon